LQSFAIGLMKKITDLLTYILFRAFVFVYRFIPFRVMYIFSDGMFYLLYYILRYRRDVVTTNLRNSFPEKPEQELKQIEKGFYHHLCDLLLESIKSSAVSETALRERYRIVDPEPMDSLYRQGRPVIVVTGHYNNWEWGGIVGGYYLMHRPVGFYKPLSNPYMDRYIQKTRVKGRSVLASITRTTEFFAMPMEEPAVFYMISDQSPSSPRLAYWVTFMNQDTATLHGPEKYARLYNYPVLFMDVQKLKRGKYTFGFELLAENPNTFRTGEITALFMKRLERQIREKPEYYLWSHRRWKLKKPL